MTLTPPSIQGTNISTTFEQNTYKINLKLSSQFSYDDTDGLTFTEHQYQVNSSTLDITSSTSNGTTTFGVNLLIDPAYFQFKNHKLTFTGATITDECIQTSYIYYDNTLGSKYIMKAD